MVSFIDEQREEHGVEPICRQLPIAPSVYYEQKAREADPSKLPERSVRDMGLREEIERVWKENLGVYGARKVWRQLIREKVDVARCTVERLMRGMGLQGVVHGRKVKITVPDDLAERPLDLVQLDFSADRPNQLWVGIGSSGCVLRGTSDKGRYVNALLRSERHPRGTEWEIGKCFSAVWESRFLPGSRQPCSQGSKYLFAFRI